VSWVQVPSGDPKKGIIVMFNKIIIVYWRSHYTDKLNLKHGEEIDYSIEKLNEIINKVLSSDLNIMTQTQTTNCGMKILYIWIDNGRFRQM
jgi:hypothetical protein